MSVQLNDTTYSGTYSEYLITRALFGMTTVKKGLCYIKGDISKYHTIERVDLVNPLSPNQAVPTDSGNNPYVIDGRIIIPGSVQAYREVNPRIFEQSQIGLLLANTILDRDVPQDIQTKFIQLLLNRSAEQFEIGLYQASKAYLGHYSDTDAQYQIQYFNGYLQRMVSDGLLVRCSFSQVAITTSNIASIYDDAINQFASSPTTKALIVDDNSTNDMKFIISISTWFITMQYLTTGTPYKGLSLDAKSTQLVWKGYRIEPTAGCPDNTVMFQRASEDPNISNLWIGMNSQKDWQVKVKRTPNELSEVFGILAKWKYDVQYGWGQEQYLYTTLTAASFLPTA